MFKRKTRHAFIIQDHVIRYAMLDQPNPDGIAELKERYLPPGVIKNGHINEEETFLTILQECAEEWKLKRKQVMFTVPDQLAVIRRHSVPADIPEDEITGYLYMDLGKNLHLPINEPVIDWHETSVTDEMRELMLFAAPEESVSQFSRLLEEVRLKPVAADLSNLAFFRLFYELDMMRKDDHLLLIQCSPLSANVTVFDGEIPVIMRHLNLDLPEDNWKLAESENGMELSWVGEPEELERAWRDILDDIVKLMNFYKFNYQQGQKEITRVVLAGDHPVLTRLTEETEREMNVPVMMMEERLEHGDAEIVPLKYYEAVGLAVKKEVS